MYKAYCIINFSLAVSGTIFPIGGREFDENLPQVISEGV